MSGSALPADQAARQAPVRPIHYAAPEVVCERAGADIYLRSAQKLADYEPHLGKWFRAAADRHPARTFLAQRDANGAWQALSYGQVRRQVDAVAQAILDLRLSAQRPILILSGNSIEHAVIMLAGFTVGVPVAPVSVAYSLQSQDFGKLRHIAALLTPGLVYAADTGPFAKALACIDAPIWAGRNSAGLDGVTEFETLASATATAAVERACAQVSGETIAKFLFTSGSTGYPKAVINTHRMLASNQQALAQVWPFAAEQPLVLLDWLPWSHTFGGNHNFNLLLAHAGTLHIDSGKPVPGLIEATVANLREVSPTIYFNVPAGFSALLPFLESDDALARAFFAKLRLIFYAGAALPSDLWERLEAISLRTIGARVPMTSSWGSTETAPLATAAHFLTDEPGNIGVPVPGVELKLVSAGDKFEVRVRGPNVTPGYWRSPELTATMFDDEGFYKIGDAVRLANPSDPSAGLVFAGRIAEDFKLTTGTWVHVGAVRVGALAACSPVLQDAVVAGEGRDHVALLAWLNGAGCRRIIGEGAPTDLADLARHRLVHEYVREALLRWNAANRGSSLQIRRVLLLGDAPSIDANEITDKGYINQRVALERRAGDVSRLFDGAQAADVIEV